MRLDEIEREFKEAESTLAQADQTLVAGRLNDAHKLYEQALALLTSAFGAEDGRTISCMESLGDACYELKKYDEAARRYKEVFAVRQRLGGMRDQEEAVALFKIAKAYSHAPNAREAEKHFEMAADIARKKLLPGDPVLSNILEASASYAARLKQKDKAEALREEARQNRARFGSSSQVIERYLEPLAGPRLGEQTLPPGANLRFRKEPQPDEAKEPPTEERKQINQAVALLAAVTVL
ncbi:MAG TPA: tetratricopeptide repeat protein, partial [Candidatus Obscuribacterales bacterium]